MMRKTLLAVLIAGAMVSGVQAAVSHVNGYLFGHVGQADYDTGSFYSGVPGSLDEKDTAFKIGAGVQLNSYVSIEDRKSTRLNSSHVRISYAVFCLKKKKQTNYFKSWL